MGPCPWDDPVHRRKIPADMLFRQGRKNSTRPYDRRYYYRWDFDGVDLRNNLCPLAAIMPRNFEDLCKVIPVLQEVKVGSLP